jgi:hypothetical protein
LSPFEKRVLELFKMGVQKVDKRAFKLLKKRLGTRRRAIKKHQKIQDTIKLLKTTTKKDKKESKKKN